MARISVIIVALNEEATLAALLDDLRAMREAGHELIVVDGGSRDRTRAVARRGADRVLDSPPGRARQSNLGAAAARGQLLWFLHADSRIDPRLPMELAKLVSPCWGRFDVRIEDFEEGRCRAALGLIGWTMNRRSRLTGIATGDQGLFVTRGLFDAVGGFPAQPLMEDIALSRALKRRMPPRCLDGPLRTSGRRWCERGPMRTMALMWWLRLAYWLGVAPARLAQWYR